LDGELMQIALVAASPRGEAVAVEAPAGIFVDLRHQHRRCAGDAGGGGGVGQAGGEE